MRRPSLEELQNQFLVDMFELTKRQTNEWIDMRECQKRMDLSDNDLTAITVRLREQGLIDYGFNGRGYVTPAGREHEERFMKQTYASEELKVLETIYEMGKAQQGGYVDFNEVQTNVGNLTYPFNDIIEELHSKNYLGPSIDEHVKIAPKGLEFLQKQSNNFASGNIIIQHSTVGAVALGNNNQQIVSLRVNPKFDEAIKAITELVRESGMPDDDIREALEDINATIRLASQSPTPGIIARGIHKVGSLETWFKAAGLALQASQHLPQLLTYFQSLQQ